MQATKLFQYRHIIRNLLERGGDWRGYDESFRTMRASEGWEWDEMHSQLWLMAAQRPIPKQAPQVRTPFLGRGAGSQVAPNRCYTYNSRGTCPFNPCRYRHQCRFCGGGHPGIKSPSRKGRPSPNQQGGSVKQVVPSPVSPTRLKWMLQGYDTIATNYLVTGFTVGFHLGCLGAPIQLDHHVANMKSAFQLPHVIDAKLKRRNHCSAS